MKKLVDYNWPGNVRELNNVVERELILSKGNPLTFEGLGETVRLSAIPRLLPEEWGARDMSLDEIISRHILRVLERGIILSKASSLTFEDSREAVQPSALPKPLREEKENKDLTLDEVVSKHILNTLEKTGGRVSGENGAAQLLQVNPFTLRKKMAKLGIPFGKKR